MPTVNTANVPVNLTVTIRPGASMIGAKRGRETLLVKKLIAAKNDEAK